MLLPEVVSRLKFGFLQLLLTELFNFKKRIGLSTLCMSNSALLAHTVIKTKTEVLEREG
jgi:hypothetical protein